jgi:hypothetical protein
MIQLAAWIYGSLIAAVIVFQVCLMAGAPWGKLTQGGRVQGALPVKGRVVAGFSILVLTGMAAGIMSAAGMPPNWPEWVGWVALAVQALSTLLNWITPSRSERLLWGPVTAVMLGLAAYVIFYGGMEVALLNWTGAA